MRPIVWLKVVILAGAFGIALGIAPYLVLAILKGESLTLGEGELKAFTVIFVLPSVGIWIAMARSLNKKHVTSAILPGLAWPFVTLLIGNSLNRIFRFDADFYPLLGFIAWALVLPLGVTAGVFMHRVVNSHHTVSRKST